MIEPAIAELLRQKARQYNCRDFIAEDPVSIPHAFSRLQDIEISGLFAATLAWGQRVSVLNSLRRLMAMMDNQPYDFVMNASLDELNAMPPFAHRTFNSIDLQHFILALRRFYSVNTSLELLFSPRNGEQNVGEGIARFHDFMFADADALHRTKKHVADPRRGSACKRLNMYLRWMVRRDDCGVDFGLWRTISPHQLVIPMDIHVSRVAHHLELISSNKADWNMALSLTETLKILSPNDPVQFDFALFGLGVGENFPGFAKF